MKEKRTKTLSYRYIFITLNIGIHIGMLVSSITRLAASHTTVLSAAGQAVCPCCSTNRQSLLGKVFKSILRTTSKFIQNQLLRLSKVAKIAF